MIIVRCPQVPQRVAQKRKTAVFPLKSHFVWGKSAIKFLCVKTVSSKVVGHSLPNYPCKNYWWVTSPSTRNSGSNWLRWSEIANFRSIFTRSASAVTSSEKSSINTNRKSSKHFPMSPRWTSYIVPKPPKGWLKNAASKIWTISCDNSATVRDRLLVTINH